MPGEGFKALADPTRRRILELLREGNCTAGELAEHFDISKPSLSHHLATLKNAGLVTDERHGQNIVYSLNTTVMQDLIGWFMGFTPSLVSGVWVGGEDRSIHFDRMSEGQGASMALPIYGLYMQKVYADKTLGYSQEEDFDIPEQYQDPCKMTTEEERKQTPTDVGGIDKMFE